MQSQSRIPWSNTPLSNKFFIFYLEIIGLQRGRSKIYAHSISPKTSLLEMLPRWLSHPYKLPSVVMGDAHLAAPASLLFLLPFLELLRVNIVVFCRLFALGFHPSFAFTNVPLANGLTKLLVRFAEFIFLGHFSFSFAVDLLFNLVFSIHQKQDNVNRFTYQFRKF